MGLALFADSSRRVNHDAWPTRRVKVRARASHCRSIGWSFAMKTARLASLVVAAATLAACDGPVSEQQSIGHPDMGTVFSAFDGAAVPMEPPPPEEGNPDAGIRPGTLTAGAWDDNLNFD